MDKISIVVPVYNVEKYLEKCLNSIINQTYKNLEIILVDDGSKDNSSKICDEYAEKDSRIIVIHQENGGLSMARNVGTFHASGEYVSYVDSDDFISENMIEKLHISITKNNCDLAVGGLLDCYGEIPNDNREVFEEVIDKNRFLNLALTGEKMPLIYAWGKLYKKSLCDKFSFPVGKTYEDAFVILDVIKNCDKIYITNEIFYYYIRRKISITTTINSKIFDVIEAHDRNYKIIKKDYPQFLNLAQTRRCWARFQVLDRLMLKKEHSWKREENEIISFLKNNKNLILKSNVFTKGRKISFISLLISKNLYRKFVEYNEKKNNKLYN